MKIDNYGEKTRRKQLILIGASKTMMCPKLCHPKYYDDSDAIMILNSLQIAFE